MDAELIRWARRAARPGRPPPLWLFTDAARVPDPMPAIARLPRGLAGVVFRHDGMPGRAALAARVAAMCRCRRLAMTVAGDTPLAAQVACGPHLRGGRRQTPMPPGRWITASAHDGAELRRALRAGADLVFLSPVFPTRSHPGAPSLGVARMLRLARQARGRAAALGGVDGVSVRRLPLRFIGAVGAIGALAPAPAGQDG